MTTVAMPALFALLVWWAGTGFVLYLDRRPARTFRRSVLVSSVVAALAVAGLVATRDLATVAGAYASFTCAVLLWGWHELTFLTGYVTGARRSACPSGCNGWRHFRHAYQAIAHHELALAAALAVVLAIGLGAANPFGAWTFLLLWALRLSAKLNLFLGVRNAGAELLPGHLRYLESFFGRRPWNPLLPVSLAASALLATLLALRAFADDATQFTAAGFGLLAAMATLGFLEHVFLILPWPASRLWDWNPNPLEGDAK